MSYCFLIVFFEISQLNVSGPTLDAEQGTVKGCARSVSETATQGPAVSLIVDPM